MLPKAVVLLLVSFFILALGALSLLFNHPGFAQRIVSYSFWPMLIALIFYLKDIKNEK